MTRRKVLIDTDTASDDAVALIMALRSPLVEVVAVTTVAGNVRVDQGTLNALYTVQLCGVNVPVHAGASGPIRRPLEIADWFHGADGLGDHGYTPEYRIAAPAHAIDAIVAAVHANPGIEIITLGPLTNLALALQRDPGIIPGISRCVVMGGAPCCEGNVTPAAEFNMWVDPEAAHIVFSSGLPIELVGWQLSRFSAVLGPADIAEVLALDTPLARFAVHCNSSAADAYKIQTGEDGISLPDPIAMAVLLDPSLILESSEHFVRVETASDLTRGMTVVDRLGVAGDDRNRITWNDTLVQSAPCKVCWKLDVSGWKKMLLRSLRESLH